MLENTIKVECIEEPGFSEETLVMTAYARPDIIIAKEVHHSINAGIITEQATDEQVKHYNLIIIGQALSFAERLNLQIYPTVFSWKDGLSDYAGSLFEKVRQDKPINYHQQALWPKNETYQEYLKDLVEEIKLLWGKPSEARILRMQYGGHLSDLTKQIQEMDIANNIK
ncbi:hypothetical protein [Furfurilactobacillus curtus]|uniref:Uncharacterized protein n=1 Tax=Furfurilactobacillus curtus TaxID=1746200 RepID=A0ABQ5JNS7_9LACO